MPHHRSRGIALIVLSALAFSTAGVFVKVVAAGPLAIVFWRSLGAIAVIFLYTLAKGEMRTELKNIGGCGVAVAITGAVGTFAFVPAFKLTSIAHVSMIYAAPPSSAPASLGVGWENGPNHACCWAAGLCSQGSRSSCTIPKAGTVCTGTCWR